MLMVAGDVMLQSFDKWLLKRYVKEARRLSPESFVYLFDRWKANAGWRRHVVRFYYLTIPTYLLLIIFAHQFNDVSFFPGLIGVIAILVLTFWMSVVEIDLRLSFLRLWRGERFCFKCGYDLRGTVASGACVCPECGADWQPEPAE